MATTTCELPEVTEQTETATESLYWVALFLPDRRYGGPEEGGWWYDTGSLISDQSLYNEIGMLPQAFTDPEKAAAYCREMNAARDRAGLNEDRPPIDSVLCDGVYGAEVHEDFLPRIYPASKPYYC